MSTKNVYSFRIPIKFKRMMEEMDDVNWQEEIRESAIKLIQEKSKERLLEDAQRLRKRMKGKISSAELVREDRDAR